MLPDYTGSAPVNVRLFARALGLEVIVDPQMDKAVSGKIERTPNGFKITVNGQHNRQRQRFTLAHEIGHYALHQEQIGTGITDDAMYRSSLGGALEEQANDFAANLLMPASLVKAAWRDDERSFVGMADRFDVSVEAATIRMRKLRLGGL